MRALLVDGSFKRDWKKTQRSGVCSADELNAIVDLLLVDAPLPDRLRDHALSGPWKKLHARECHINPVLLLVYSKPEHALRLLRLAGHSELFG